MRPTAAVALVLLVAPALAGCVSPSVQTAGSEDAVALLPFDINATPPERLVLQVADGTKLDLAVVRPAGDEPVPVIVDIGPYFGNLSPGILQYAGVDLRLAEYFVPRGYAIARASLRGTGESEGCFDLGGKTEQQDVHDIVQFLGQQPWSNGNVAVFGKSYDGTTPWMAAITQPSHLKTIVPISGISDMYRYMFYDGVAYPEEVGFNTIYYLLVDDDIDPGFEGIQGTPGAPRILNTDPQHHLTKNVVRTCDGLVEQTLWQTASTLTGDHGEAFWIERDYEPHMDKVQVPVLMVHGLQDWNVKPDHEVPLWNDLAVPKALFLGQWAHDYPDINRFNAEWSRTDWNETLLVWFDVWLKGVDPASYPEGSTLRAIAERFGADWSTLSHVQVQDPLGRWRDDTSWPPRDGVEVALLPAADGMLRTDVSAAKMVLRDPLAQGFDPRTGERGLAFVTGELASEVVISGSPRLEVQLTSDRPLGHLVAMLYDVAPDGTWTEIDHGARDIRHRETREKGSPVTPGAAFSMPISFYPQELVIPAGHRLGLAIAAEHPGWYLRAPLAPTYTIEVGPTALHLLVRDAGMAQALRDAASAQGHAGHGLALASSIP